MARFKSVAQCDCCDVPGFYVKVRGLKYVWGSAGVTQDVSLERAFVLHITNDLAGELVTIGTQISTGTQTKLGTIAPGERISVSVNHLSGVYADCDSESLVRCCICH